MYEKHVQFQIEKHHSYFPLKHTTNWIQRITKQEKKKKVCVHSKPYGAKPKEIILQKNTYIHKWLYFKITVVCRQTLNKSKSLVDYVHWNDKITQNGKVKSVFPTWSYNFLHPKFSISGKKIITSVAFFFHLLDHWNSISKFLDPLLLSGNKVYSPATAPSITTRSIWIVTFPKELCCYKKNKENEWEENSLQTPT